MAGVEHLGSLLTTLSPMAGVEHLGSLLTTLSPHVRPLQLHLCYDPSVLSLSDTIRVCGPSLYRSGVSDSVYFPLAKNVD